MRFSHNAEAYIFSVAQYVVKSNSLWILKAVICPVFPVASKKTLTYFNHDYKADLQEVSFDQQEVKKIFYGSFHKVFINKGRNVAHDFICSETIMPSMCIVQSEDWL